MRKICYLTGTRADFGLMAKCLGMIDRHPDLELSIVVTGSHLVDRFGRTVTEIERLGLPVSGSVPVALSGESGAEMALAVAEQIRGCTEQFEILAPDCVVVLGDRGEMLAAAIAAVFLNRVVVHVHGGELSGTIDESIRHAISKLAHYHFVATRNSEERLLRMGESQENIFVTGAPGLDDVIGFEPAPRERILSRYDLSPEGQFLLLVFHPVLQQSDRSGLQMKEVLAAVADYNGQVLILMPNSDAGRQPIAARVEDFAASRGGVSTAVHLAREDYLSLLAHAEVLVGNSSSGIIEAASLGTPVVNVGTRQQSRERNPNVIDAPVDKAAIGSAIDKARALKGRRFDNAYGDGDASRRIVERLLQISLDAAVLEKTNAY